MHSDVPNFQQKFRLRLLFSLFLSFLQKNFYWCSHKTVLIKKRVSLLRKSSNSAVHLGRGERYSFIIYTFRVSVQSNAFIGGNNGKTG